MLVLCLNKNVDLSYETEESVTTICFILRKNPILQTTNQETWCQKYLCLVSNKVITNNKYVFFGEIYLVFKSLLCEKCLYALPHLC